MSKVYLYLQKIFKYSGALALIFGVVSCASSQSVGATSGETDGIYYSPEKDGRVQTMQQADGNDYDIKVGGAYFDANGNGAEDFYYEEPAAENKTAGTDTNQNVNIYTGGGNIITGGPTTDWGRYDGIDVTVNYWGGYGYGPSWGFGWGYPWGWRSSWSLGFGWGWGGGYWGSSWGWGGGYWGWGYPYYSGYWGWPGYWGWGGGYWGGPYWGWGGGYYGGYYGNYYGGYYGRRVNPGVRPGSGLAVANSRNHRGITSARSTSGTPRAVRGGVSSGNNLVSGTHGVRAVRPVRASSTANTETGVRTGNNVRGQSIRSNNPGSVSQSTQNVNPRPTITGGVQSNAPARQVRPTAPLNVRPNQPTRVNQGHNNGYIRGNTSPRSGAGSYQGPRTTSPRSNSGGMRNQGTMSAPRSAPSGSMRSGGSMGSPRSSGGGVRSGGRR